MVASLFTKDRWSTRAPAPGRRYSVAVTELSFTRAGLDDAVVQQMFCELPWGVGDLTAPEFAPPGGAIVVAWADGAPVGMAGLRELRVGEDGAPRGEVKRLFVRPAGRRRGVARALLSELERIAREIGYGELWLDTHAPEPAAMFRSAGYVDIPAYNENGYARYWFAKQV
jgi:GNAT superfamily N-acetyltransferase